MGFSGLLDAVHYYESCFTLDLIDREKDDLMEFLKSLAAPDQQ